LVVLKSILEVLVPNYEGISTIMDKGYEREDKAS